MIKWLKRINLIYVVVAIIVIMWVGSIFIIDSVTRSKNSFNLQDTNNSHLVAAPNEEKTLSKTPGTATNPSADSTPSVEGYTPPSCEQTPIAHKTVYENAPWLYIGEAKEDNSTPAHDGYIKKCTADSNGHKPADITYEASDKKIFIGTKVKLP